MNDNYVALLRCLICGDGSGIMLHRQFRDISAMHNKVDPGQPFCSKCEQLIAAGNTFLISVRDGESGDNPYRTGRLCAITHDACERILKAMDAPDGTKHPPLFFVPDTQWEKMGLPTETVDYSKPEVNADSPVNGECQVCHTVRRISDQLQSEGGKTIKALCATCNERKEATEDELLTDHLISWASEDPKPSQP